MTLTEWRVLWWVGCVKGVWKEGELENVRPVDGKLSLLYTPVLFSGPFHHKVRKHSRTLWSPGWTRKGRGVGSGMHEMETG